MASIYDWARFLTQLYKTWWYKKEKKIASSILLKTLNFLPCHIWYTLLRPAGLFIICNSLHSHPYTVPPFGLRKRSCLPSTRWMAQFPSHSTAILTHFSHLLLTFHINTSLTSLASFIRSNLALYQRCLYSSLKVLQPMSPLGASIATYHHALP